MPIRITGLNSGLDTESIISALVSSYNYKTQKYQKAQTKLSWKQDAWKTLNTKIYSLYKSAGNMKLSSAYNAKSATVSDSTKISVTAGSSSVNGSYSVHVTSMAKAGYLTGGKLDSDTTAATKLSDLGYDKSGTMSLTVNGKTTDIAVDGKTTIQEVVNSLKEAGVNASFDEKNKRLYISAKGTGTENDFSLSGGNENGSEALEALGLDVMSKAEKAQYNALAEYYGEDISDIVTNKQNAAAENEILKARNENYALAIQYVNAKAAVAKVENGDGYTGTDLVGDYALLKELASESDLSNKYVINGKVYTKEDKTYTAADGSTYTEDEDGTIKDAGGNEIEAEAASEKLNELAISFGMSKEVETEEKDENGDSVKEIVVDTDALKAYQSNLSVIADVTERTSGDEADEELKTFVTELENGTKTIAEYEASQENNQTQIMANETILTDDPFINEIMENAKKAVDNELEGEAYDNAYAEELEKAITAFESKVAYAQQLKESGALSDTMAANANSDGLGATRVEGSDAEIYVNGAKYTGDSNTFSINGMTITATGVTCKAGEVMTDENAVTVSVNTDVQGLYDKIKDFLSQYNSIINEMTALYNADSAKGYEPLTDEEKDAMSDAEVEKWETKIKDSLLRRDGTLSSLINNMTSVMSKGIEIGTGDDKKTYYLSSFGIKTLGYLNAPKNEQNAYHIDGDEDDVNTSGNADKLMAAIAEDPDTVIEFMQKLSDNLYDSIHKKMQSTSLSSVYTVYNDKEMASEYSDYTSLITKWQERLEQQEEYYYNKFASMESALAKLNSQTSSLSGLFG